VAWVAGVQAHHAKVMVEYCVLKKTKLIDDSVILPRPKLTQELVMRGSKEDCKAKVEELSLKPENQSTDMIEVAIVCVEFTGQKTHNSKEIHRDNGKRNFGC